MKAFQLLILLLCFCWVGAFAQPVNDNCGSATIIPVAGAGFGFGTFTSSISDMTNATVQPGEAFAPSIAASGLNKKSAWFKFSLPTTRSVRVSLEQPGAAIAQSDIGFTVYKSSNCLPAVANISTEFTPIPKFGSTYHPCVGAGDYLVQVSSNNGANGSIRISLSISDSSGALYDHPQAAYPFGLLSQGVDFVNYTVECQSIEDATESCTAFNVNKYTKTSWHTFTTPSYFDYIVIAVSHGLYNQRKVIGYQLYKGDATSVPISSLTNVSGCDSILPDGIIAGYKLYKCGGLLANTTYSLQLLFEKDFISNVTVKIDTKGVAPAQAPEPILTSLPASNQLGTLPDGTTNVTDFFGCNSRHTLHPCGQALPANGLVFSGIQYNLSTFYTFTLATAAEVTINVGSSCGPPILASLYSQPVTSNCASLQSSQLLDQTRTTIHQSCVPAGKYTLQISGTDMNYTPGAYTLCQLSNLGSEIAASIVVVSTRGSNTFSLQNANAYDHINAMQPLLDGVSYQAAADTFGCANTVRPAGDRCDTFIVKATYRQFNIADSGILNINSLRFFDNKLYLGNASALAASQNAFTYPDTINGLVPYSACMKSLVGCKGNNACVIPGTYTFAGMEGGNYNIVDRPVFEFRKKETKHFSPATAQDLGSILDSVAAYNNPTIISDDDYFSCRDNAVTINGFTPCDTTGIVSTKAIYRQFYLSKPASLIISGYYYDNACGTLVGGLITLFNGKVSNGINGLTIIDSTWNCFLTTGPPSCKQLPAGWYTLVSYGTGPTYSNPQQNIDLTSDGYVSSVGVKDRITITVAPSCLPPKYNHPYTAAIDSVTNQPFSIKWVPQPGHTAAYPVTGTTYILPMEHFNCTIDTLFSYPLTVCHPAMNRVAFYVFKTTQVSYLEINTKGYWGELFDKDVRQDSALFGSTTPVQPCLRASGFIQLCSLQPGIYTLVLFAGEDNNCDSVKPEIRIDQSGISRFDFAAHAYDFGVVAPDSTFHYGKTGDVNPLNPLRKPSNDFFYCTTGAAPGDPTNSNCNMAYNPNIYNPGVNNHLFDSANMGGRQPLRNLWYTFVIKEGGYVQVKTDSTLSSRQTHFAVFESDVNGSLPFSTVVTNGEVDSTMAQGLTLVGESNCVKGYDTVTFFRNPCTAVPTRYYVLVDGLPNGQTEVAVMLDSIKVVQPRFDHYSQASDMGYLNTGTFIGQTDNYACATSDLIDPPDPVNGCSPKTLWYRFVSNVTGHINFSLTEDGLAGQAGALLFRQIIPGDSTASGLEYVTSDSSCIFPGTYYLMLKGCNKFNESVFPVINLVEEAGDFCSSPVVANVNNAGTFTVSAIVDCHTIGTDYGEFGNILSCPAGAATTQYKTSWFRIDITGTDTLDVTTYLTSSTNTTPSDIKYRMMIGNCSAMQEGSCVQDSRTRDTYKCLANGSYFIQVFTPVSASNNDPVIGNINLHLIAVHHSDTCAPVSSCLATSNFLPTFDCTKDKAVTCNNFSTYGTVIQYKWDLGYAGQTSTAVSPSFTYPALAAGATYNIQLIVTNTSCVKSDTSSMSINVPGRPLIQLPNDTLLCNGGSVFLDATSWPGATYTWQDGSVNPTYNAGYVTSNIYYVQVDYNGCSSRDTVIIDINPVTPQIFTGVLCPGDSILLESIRGFGETYQWNTGSNVSYIWAKTSGVFYNDITYATCVTRDSFTIIGPVYPFANKDTFVCLLQPFWLNATVPQANHYNWNTGVDTPAIKISSSGLYYVDISFRTSTCTLRDSINVFELKTDSIILAASICQGKTYTLPWGAVVGTAGVYSDTLHYLSGCDSVITKVNVSVANPIISVASVNICSGNTYTLPWGAIAATTGTYSDTTRFTAGCDSLIQTINLNVEPVLISNISATICSNQNYTLPWGPVVGLPGIYKDTIRYASGCDSLRTNVTLTTNPVSRVSIGATICQGKTYSLPWGGVVNAAGVYRDTLINSLGCDSIITVNLSVNPSSASTTNARICASLLPYHWNGNSYNLAGVYQVTLINAAGCDSVATLVFKIDTATASSTKVNVCSAFLPYQWNGSTYTASGTYTKTLVNAAGCDSIATLVLSVKSSSASSFNKTICASQLPFVWNGNNYFSGGVYKDTLVNAAGCDSVVTLTLLVNPTTTSITGQTICSDQLPFSWNGHQYASAGTYFDTLVSSSGCDSVASLVLKVNPIPSQPAITSNSPVCLGNTLLLTAYSASAVSYLWTLPNGQNVNAKDLSIDNVSFAQAGVYSIATFANGCGSAASSTVVRVLAAPVVNAGPDLQLHEGDTAVIVATATGANLRYQWTPNLYFLSSDTIKTPAIYGVKDIVYTLTATESGKCPASDMVLIRVLPRVNPIFIPNVFSPNSDGKNDLWVIRQLAAYPDATVEIYTRYGAKIFSSSGGYKHPWDGTYKSKPMPTGTYYYIITPNQKSKPITGWVMLIR